MFFFYSQLNLSDSYLGVIIAHAALATPFVIITVNVALSEFHYSLVRASMCLGDKSVYTYSKLLFP
jgi:putative spermidine/putrescine transport system permease protein